MAGLVLLVHDDIATIAVIRRLLAREGNEIVLATSAADAVIAFGHHLPAVIILAPAVEGGRGQSALEEIQRHPGAKKAKVLLLGEALRGQSWPVIPLPLDGAQFLDQVSQALRGEPVAAAAPPDVEEDEPASDSEETTTEESPVYGEDEVPAGVELGDGEPAVTERNAPPPDAAEGEASAAETSSGYGEAQAEVSSASGEEASGYGEAQAEAPSAYGSSDGEAQAAASSAYGSSDGEEASGHGEAQSVAGAGYGDAQADASSSYGEAQGETASAQGAEHEVPQGEEALSYGGAHGDGQAHPAQSEAAAAVGQEPSDGEAQAAGSDSSGFGEAHGAELSGYGAEAASGYGGAQGDVASGYGGLQGDASGDGEVQADAASAYGEAAAGDASSGYGEAHADASSGYGEAQADASTGYGEAQADAASGYEAQPGDAASGYGGAQPGEVASEYGEAHGDESSGYGAAQADGASVYGEAQPSDAASGYGGAQPGDAASEYGEAQADAASGYGEAQADAASGYGEAQADAASGYGEERAADAESPSYDAAASAYGSGADAASGHSGGADAAPGSGDGQAGDEASGYSGHAAAESSGYGEEGDASSGHGLAEGDAASGYGEATGDTASGYGEAAGDAASGYGEAQGYAAYGDGADADARFRQGEPHVGVEARADGADATLGYGGDAPDDSASFAEDAAHAGDSEPSGYGIPDHEASGYDTHAGDQVVSSADDGAHAGDGPSHETSAFTDSAGPDAGLSDGEVSAGGSAEGDVSAGEGWGEASAGAEGDSELDRLEAEVREEAARRRRAREEALQRLASGNLDSPSVEAAPSAPPAPSSEESDFGDVASELGSKPLALDRTDKFGVDPASVGAPDTTAKFGLPTPQSDVELTGKFRIAGASTDSETVGADDDRLAAQKRLRAEERARLAGELAAADAPSQKGSSASDARRQAAALARKEAEAAAAREIAEAEPTDFGIVVAREDARAEAEAAAAREIALLEREDAAAKEIAALEGPEASSDHAQDGEGRDARAPTETVETEGGGPVAAPPEKAGTELALAEVWDDLEADPDEVKPLAEASPSASAGGTVEGERAALKRAQALAREEAERAAAKEIAEFEARLEADRVAADSADEESDGFSIDEDVDEQALGVEAASDAASSADEEELAEAAPEDVNLLDEDSAEERAAEAASSSDHDELGTETAADPDGLDEDPEELTAADDSELGAEADADEDPDALHAAAASDDDELHAEAASDDDGRGAGGDPDLATAGDTDADWESPEEGTSDEPDELADWDTPVPARSKTEPVAARAEAERAAAAERAQAEARASAQRAKSGSWDADDAAPAPRRRPQERGSTRSREEGDALDDVFLPEALEQSRGEEASVARQALEKLEREQDAARLRAQGLSADAARRQLELEQAESLVWGSSQREEAAQHAASHAQELARAARRAAETATRVFDDGTERPAFEDPHGAHEEADRERGRRAQLEEELQRMRVAADQARSAAEAAVHAVSSERATREAAERALLDARREAQAARVASERRAVASLIPFEVPGRAAIEVPSSGSVDLAGLVRVVLTLVRSGAEAKLELRCAEALRTLWFHRGAIVGATSSLAHETLLERARRDGLLDSEQERELRLLRGAASAELIRVLRARGYVRDTEAVPLVQRYTEQVALEALSEPQSIYLISREPVPESEAVAVAPRSALQLLTEALRRAIPPDAALESVGGLDAIPFVKDPSELRALGLSERERRLLESADGESTIEELLLESGLRQEVAARLLAAAWTLQLMEVTPPAAPRPLPSPELDTRRLDAKYREIQESDYFSILGLSRSAGTDEVHRAFSSLSSEFNPLRFVGHPDPSLVLRAREVTDVLAEAAHALQDDRLREDYARSLTD